MIKILEFWQSNSLGDLSGGFVSMNSFVLPKFIRNGKYIRKEMKNRLTGI